MKRLFLAVPIYLTCFLGNAHATFVSGSSGADGAFSPTANTELQLPADGIFNFTTVNIPAGVTVTFKKNASNTPVYILATGDVTIAGTINVNGQSTSSSTGTAEGKGGTGGYDGGYGGQTALPGGKGLGPGGGSGGPNSSTYVGGGGGFGTVGGTWGGAGGPVYGNIKIVPFLGGSGGGGMANNGYNGYGGGGGGGAILIASSTTISITGSITANGGSGYDHSGSGSGGAVKLQANIITGNGSITARGGMQGMGLNNGGAGRIRLEAYTNNRMAGTDPPYTFGIPESVFIANAPTLTITSIAGVNVPSSPTGAYATPDVALPSTTSNPVAVIISGANIPVGTAVMVRAVPQYGSETTGTSTLSGTVQSSTASVNVNISTTYSNVLSAEATYTVTGMYYDGEEIDRVRIAATMGGKSETTYITKSGKEIKGEMLAMVRK